MPQDRNDLRRWTEFWTIGKAVWELLWQTLRSLLNTQEIPKTSDQNHILQLKGE